MKIRGAGSQVAVSFFVVGLLILLGLPQMLPALYRTFEPEKEEAKDDQERLKQIEAGLQGLQLFVSHTVDKIGELFVVALGIAALGAFDEDAAKTLAALILFLLIVRDWAEINAQLGAMSVPRQAPKQTTGTRKA